MRKTITILIVVTLLGIIAAYEVPAGGKQQTSSSSSSQTSNRASTPTTSQNQTTTTAGLKSGTYTGATATNLYDEIQVAITVSGGKITSITTPVLTGDTGHSDEINSYAIPQLTQQAIASQSSQIDGISGASYTTQSYIESLQSAIDQAKA